MSSSWTPPLRGQAKLDSVAANLQSCLIGVVGGKQQETDDGQSASDHAFLSYRFHIEHRHRFEWVRYQVRQISDKAVDKYDCLMKEVDWGIRQGEDIEHMTEDA